MFALPRSRSFWLSKFLTYGAWQCGHEELLHCRSLDDVTAWLGQPYTGTVETAAAPFWRLLPASVRVVVLRRPVAEIVDSLARAGFAIDPAQIERQACKLDQIVARVPNVLSVDYAGLADQVNGARLFEHCLGQDMPQGWWDAVSPINLQINLHHLTRQYWAFQSPLKKLAKIAKHRIIADMGADRDGRDDVVFQVESFRQFYADAEGLFAEHLVQTEQSPDDHARKNLPLLRRLDDMGSLQCLTARRHGNGRMVGYLMSVVAPSLDSPDVIQAEHTIFYASAEVNNLGMKLQRAALGHLRARGVNEVIMRAGHRGGGPRLGAFYRRLGAEPFGQIYRLALEG